MPLAQLCVCVYRTTTTSKKKKHITPKIDVPYFFLFDFFFHFRRFQTKFSERIVYYEFIMHVLYE